MKYHSKVVSSAQGFARISFRHIPREENEEADQLSRLATTYNKLPKGVDKKKNLLQSGKSGGSWVEELPRIVWSLRSTPNQATREAPFSLVYGTEAVLLAK
ncbi:hypothetical protein LIER_32392 [Lithospermum erythrorhizon]|uniref:RNase H type-1 domain-containing protein n=1 Tax=Lithospermum erythrorhizon TaxID=34254 RepID=A0AAV3RXC6_LITER